MFQKQEHDLIFFILPFVCFFFSVRHQTTIFPSHHMFASQRFLPDAGQNSHLDSTMTSSKSLNKTGALVRSNWLLRTSSVPSRYTQLQRHG